MTSSSQSPLSLHPNFVPSLGREDTGRIIRVGQYSRTVSKKVAELIDIYQKECWADNTALGDAECYVLFVANVENISDEENERRFGGNC